MKNNQKEKELKWKIPRKMKKMKNSMKNDKNEKIPWK